MDSKELPADELLAKTTLVLLAVALNAVEFFIPRIPFLPWLKPGLANIITIIWIVRFGVLDALLFSLLRTWIVGFYIGFSFVTLTLAMSGGITATLAMGLSWKLLGKQGRLGIFGLGVIGALFHNAGQLAAVYLMMAHNLNIFYQTPVMITASVVFGGGVGLLTVWAWPMLAAPSHQGASLTRRESRSVLLRPAHAIVSAALFGCCIGVMFIDAAVWLGGCAIGATLLVQIVDGLSLKNLFGPVRRFWLLFAFIAAVYLFLSYGRTFAGARFLTHEGVTETVVQWLRLWTWLQLSMLLAAFRFHAVFMASLQRLFPRHATTIEAAMLALEHLPSVIEMVKRSGRLSLKRMARSPIAEIRLGLTGIHENVVRYLGEHGA